MPDTDFESLVGDRVVVRRFRDSDAPTFAAYRSDPAVARYQGWEPPFPVAKAEAFIASLQDCHPDTPGEWFQYAVEERATGQHVGDVASHTDESFPALVRVGVTFSREAQGRGLATEALTLLFSHLMYERGIHRISADCDTRNAAVVNLLERLGMRREAHHVASWLDGDTWTDEYVYAILDEEWRTRQVG